MNRYETTFTLTVSVEAESEESAADAFDRAQIRLLECRGLQGKPQPVTITYLEPSETIDCMEVAAMRER